MSRVLRSRQLYKGCYAHVISRSIRKMKLFHDIEDFLYFKGLLIRAKEKAKFKENENGPGHLEGTGQEKILEKLKW